MKILKRLGKILGALLGLIIAYLAVVVFGPGFAVPKQPMRVGFEGGAGKEQRKPPAFREDVSFKVNGTTVRGRLYLPAGTSPPVPAIVMSNGFGGTMGVILETYARRYREAGLAVLAYDYRHFGASDGEPRQLFSNALQLEDLRAAIRYARGRTEIDPEQIALWGTSGSGGYGLIIAARDKRIAAVVGQCPALDHDADAKIAVEREGVGHFLRLFVHAQRDKGRSRFGLSPHSVPIVGQPGTLAFLTAPGAFEGYAELAALNFKNEVLPRFMLEGDQKNPIDYAIDVKVPVLLQVGEKDTLASPKSAEQTAQILGKHAELKTYPFDHFGFYLGEPFERTVEDQITFLKKHLGK